MDRPISMVDIIIDRHERYDMSYIVSLLKSARINKHDVLHFVLKDVNVNPKEEIRVPHIYHNYVCEGRDLCEEKTPEPWPYLRNFNVQLILDGAVHLADWETTDFELQMDVLLMISNVVVVPQVEDYQRWDLVKPWRK